MDSAILATATAVIDGMDGVDIADMCAGHARYEGEYEGETDCFAVRYLVEFAGMAERYGCKPKFNPCCLEHMHAYDDEIRANVIGALADAGLTARDVWRRVDIRRAEDEDALLDIRRTAAQAPQGVQACVASRKG